METIKIQLDYLNGPLWKDSINLRTGEKSTGVPIVDNDVELRRLDKEISERFNSYYQFDSHGAACWFDKEREKNDKRVMLKLLHKLRQRLDEVNDGSFDVEDLETERLEKL